jgi:hypothetical protein
MILFGWLAGLFVAAVICLPAKLNAAQPEEALLEEINRLPETERQARLINGAKKEGGRDMVCGDEPGLCAGPD